MLTGPVMTLREVVAAPAVLVCMKYNARYRGTDGKTRGYDDSLYPVDSDSILLAPLFSRRIPRIHRPGCKSKDGHATKQCRSRLVPVIFVGITIGPGCQWRQSYKAVPLTSLLSDDRAS